MPKLEIEEVRSVAPPSFTNWEAESGSLKIDRVYVNDRVVRHGINKARTFNACIRENKIDALLASMNSYLGICKNVNGYNQANKILRNLSPKWNKFVRFNSQRVCLEALPEYKTNKRIINKYHLK